MTEKINEKIGAWLLKDGNTKGLLAEKLNVSRPTLDTRLDGTSKWKWEEVVCISEITGSSLNELAGLED